MKRALLFLIACVACAATQSPRTVGKGTTAVGLSVGGLYTHIGGNLDIPLPYPVLELRRGLTDTFDVQVGTHLLMDAFGVIQFDIGGTYLLLPETRKDTSAVALSGKLMTFLNPGAPSLLIPEVTLTFSKRYKKSIFLYGGLDVAVSAKGESNGKGDEKLVIASPLLGLQVPTGKRLRTTFESTWVAPYLNTEDAVVRFPLPNQPEGGAGALSFKLGFSYQIKKDKP
jgi:hypothetical protein